MTAFPPLAIANEVLAEAWRQGKNLTTMQLLKLVYIAHGWSLGLLNQPLVDEAPQAWEHGPVFPAIYREFRRFGSGRITEQASFPLGGIYAAALDQDRGNVLRSVVSNYGDMHAFRLSGITHEENTPWSIVYQNGTGRDRPIPASLIADHYRRIAVERAAA